MDEAVKKGGKGPRVKGDVFERAVVLDLERHGWDAVRLRQGGGENIDVLAVQKCGNGWTDHSTRQPHVQYIQCKVRRGQMTKAAQEALFLRARKVSATAVLAFKEGNEIRYKELRELL